MEHLKLTALDEEDLRVVSAHMQDAVARLGDMRYLPRVDTFALLANRFVWTGEAGKETRGLRRRTGLRIGRVRRARARRVRLGAPEAVVSLLALNYTPGADGGDGTIEITLSGGGSIRLDVECIEVQMKDLGEEWPSAHVPHHDLEAGDG